MSLRKEFLAAIEIGKEVRKSGVNGQEVWQKLESKYVEIKETFPLKESFLEFLKPNLETNSKDFKDAVIRIGVFTINFKVPGHFLIQLLRLPALVSRDQNGQVPFNKMIQIGYNIGQLMASIERGDFGEATVTIREFVARNRLTELDTYSKL